MTTYENIYISGPMRNHPAFNFPAFFEAERRLAEEHPGAKIVNPARTDVERFALEHMLEADPTGFAVGQFLMDTPDLFDHECLQEALASDLYFICKHADMIYLLPGWETSSGAASEVATARALGIYVNYPELHDGPRMDLTAPIESAPVRAEDDYQKAQRVLNENLRLALDAPSPGRGPFETVEVPGWPHKFEGEDAVAVKHYAGLLGQEVRTVSATGGEKGVKLAAFDQISPEVLTLVAEHFGKGARKYSAHNFRKGYEWSKSFSALMRHLMAFWSGEEYDDHLPTCPEGCTEHTGSLHIVAVIWHAMVLTEFYLHRKEYDDRYATTAQASV